MSGGGEEEAKEGEGGERKDFGEERGKERGREGDGGKGEGERGVRLKNR